MPTYNVKLEALLVNLYHRTWTHTGEIQYILSSIEKLSQEEETYILRAFENNYTISDVFSFCAAFREIKNILPSKRYSLIDKFDAMLVQRHQEVNPVSVTRLNSQPETFNNSTLLFLAQTDNESKRAYLGKVYLHGIPGTVEPDFNQAMKLFENNFIWADPEDAFKILLENQKSEEHFLSSEEAKTLLGKLSGLNEFSKPTLAFILDIIKQAWEKDEYPIWFVIANLKQYEHPDTCDLIEEFKTIFDQKFQDLVDAYIQTLEDPISKKNAISHKIEIYFKNNQISEGQQKKVLALSTHEVTESEKSNILYLQGRVYLHQKKYDLAITTLQQAIALKHSGAMTARAHMHQNGFGGERNSSEAFKLLDDPIKLGYSMAINNRAYMYKKGLGGEEEKSNAIKGFEKAIDLDNPHAMYNLAYMLLNAPGENKNLSRIMELSERGMLLGHSSCITLRAHMHMEGLGGNKNYPKAKALLEKAIFLGNPDAMRCRAVMYINGWGTKRDLQKASELCFRATLKGRKKALEMLISLAEIEPHACFYLGKVYLYGVPYFTGTDFFKIEANPFKAMELFRKSFDLIDPETAFKILLEDQKLEEPFLSSEEAKTLLNKVANISPVIIKRGQWETTEISPIINIIEQSWEKDEYPIWFVIANLKQHLSPKTCPLIEKFNSIFDRKIQETIDAYIKTPEDPISEKNAISQKISIYFSNHQISEEHQNRILALSTNDVSEPEKSNILYLQGEVYLKQKKYELAIPALQSASALKHSGAMVSRADMYENGIGGDTNLSEAFRLLNDAIERGNSMAINNRAYMYEHGIGGDKDESKAIEGFEKASDLGNAYAMCNRASMHMEGLGGDKDYPRAIELSEKAILSGLGYAMTRRGYLHMKGFGGPPNYAKAIVLFEKAILLDDAYAMYFRALIYINRWRTQKDLQKASELCFRATLKGNKEALEKLTSLAEEGDACFHLGKVYLFGVTGLVDPDFSKAMELFRKNFYLIQDPETAFKILLENKKLKKSILSSHEDQNLIMKIAYLPETQLNSIRNIMEQSWRQHEGSIFLLIKSLKNLLSSKPFMQSTFDRLFNFFDTIFDQKFQELIRAYIGKQEESIAQKISSYFDNEQVSLEQQNRILALSTGTCETADELNISYLKGRVYLHQKKYKEAINALDPAIKLNPDAMNARAWMYENGWGETGLDHQKATDLYYEAILHGSKEAFKNLDRFTYASYYLTKLYLFGAPGFIEPNFSKAVESFRKNYGLIDPETAFKMLLENQKLDIPLLSLDETKILLKKIENLSALELIFIINIIEQSWKGNEFSVWFIITNLKQHLFPKTCSLIEKFDDMFGQKFQELVKAYIEKRETSALQNISTYLVGNQISETQQSRILALPTKMCEDAELLKQAISLGDPFAMYYRALICEKEENYPEADKLIKQIILLDGIDYQKLSEQYFQAISQGDEIALKKLTFLAEKENNKYTRFYLGKAYLSEIPGIIKPNFNYAVELFRKNFSLIDSETAFKILLENQKLETSLLSPRETNMLLESIASPSETALTSIMNIIQQSWKKYANHSLSIIMRLELHLAPAKCPLIDEYEEAILLSDADTMLKHAELYASKEGLSKKVCELYFRAALKDNKEAYGNLARAAVGNSTPSQETKYASFYLGKFFLLKVPESYPNKGHFNTAMEFFRKDFSLIDAETASEILIKSYNQIDFTLSEKEFSDLFTIIENSTEKEKHYLTNILKDIEINQSGKPWYKTIFYLQSILNVKTLSASDTALTHFMLAKLYDSEDKIYLSKWHLDQISDEALKQEIASRSLSLPPDINIPSKSLKDSLTRLVNTIKKLKNPKTLLFFNKSESYSETTTYIFNIFLYQLTTYQNALKEKQT
ncbi:MAG: sel1 repeat family protein, partial [Proteobacteria bacterium]|nr:sel1 repeat family protein [Pseudomonadota bacterium]